MLFSDSSHFNSCIVSFFPLDKLRRRNKLVNSKVNGRCWLCNAHRPPKVLGTPLESPMDPFSHLWRERETVRGTSFNYEYLAEKSIIICKTQNSNIPTYCANETLTLTPALVFTLGADVEI